MTGRSHPVLAMKLVWALVLLVPAGPGHAVAPVGRYAIGTDTVLDNVTRLTWQRAVPTSISGIAGCSGGTCTWAGAKSYCTALDLGGLSWRLPRKLELESLVDFGSSNPAIDPAAFPGTPAGFYWSSSPVVRVPDNAWGVAFDDGYSVSDGASRSHSVRCVH